MAELKTTVNDKSVVQFISRIDDDGKREACLTLLALMQQVTGAEPRMWGDSIVGFGSYHYRYESGREGDWFLTGFSPRKQNLTIYIMSGLERHAALLKKLGTHKTGKSCLYLKRIEDIDLGKLQNLIEKSVEHLSRTYPSA